MVPHRYFHFLIQHNSVTYGARLRGGAGEGGDALLRAQEHLFFFWNQPGALAHRLRRRVRHRAPAGRRTRVGLPSPSWASQPSPSSILSGVLVQVSIIGFVNWLYFILLNQNYVFYNSRQTKPDQCNGQWAMETKDDERWGGWQTLSHYRKPCTLHVFQLQGSSSLWLTARATDFLSNHACDALQSVFFK